MWLPALVLAGIGLAIRLAGFRRGMWEDEMTMAYYTQIGIKNVIATVAQNGSHPPLYFMVAAIDSRLGMDVLPAIRVPSLVAGVLTILVVYFLALRLTGRAGGLVAGALTTVAPVAVWYSDEGRMYALLWLFVLLSYLLLALGHDSRWWRVFGVLYALTVGLALWTDYSAALALLPQPLLIVLLRHRRWFFAAWIAGWLSFVPWLFFLREQYGRIENQSFPGVGTDLQSWIRVLLQLASVRADYAAIAETLPLAAEIAVLTLLGAAAVATVAGALHGRARVAIIALSLTVGALAIAIAIAFQGAQAVILARIMGIISFGFVLMFAGAIAIVVARQSWSTRVAAAVCAAVLVGCITAAGLNVVQNGTSGVTWDVIADTIQQNAQPGDALIYYPVVAKYGVDPYLSPSSRWHKEFNGRWPTDDATAEQSFATWTAGAPRVWFVFYAISGVDMPQHDQWFMQHGLCRVMGDPTAGAGVIEYQASTSPCPPP